MGWRWRAYQMIRDYSGFNLAQDFIGTRNQSDAVFIWIPKAAGTSVHRSLGFRKRKTLHSVRFQFSGQGMVTFGHMDYRALVDQGYVSTAFDRRAFKCAIVRDPYDRAVSLYVYLKDKARVIPADKTFLDFLRDLSDGRPEPIGLYNLKGFSQCNPQVRWLENVDMDFVGRMENLVADVESIGVRLGVNGLSLKRENVSRRGSLDRYYCPESKDLVELLFEEDFRVLGYQIKPKLTSSGAGS